MPKVEELIAKCRNEEMFTQNLQENILEMTASEKVGRITFTTDPQIVLDTLNRRSPKIGVVIWFPSDVFER